MLRRLRTFTLWTGTTLSVLIAVGFVVSGSGFVVAEIETPYRLQLMLRSGAISVHLENPLNSGVYVEWDASGLGDFEYWNLWEIGVRYVILPLYAVFAATAIPTLLIWRFVPKFPRGHCRRCGYSLTGLTEARCPECGAGFVSNRV